MMPALRKEEETGVALHFSSHFFLERIGNIADGVTGVARLFVAVERTETSLSIENSGV